MFATLLPTYRVVIACSQLSFSRLVVLFIHIYDTESSASLVTFLIHYSLLVIAEEAGVKETKGDPVFRIKFFKSSSSRIYLSHVIHYIAFGNMIFIATVFIYISSSSFFDKHLYSTWISIWESTLWITSITPFDIFRFTTSDVIYHCANTMVILIRCSRIISQRYFLVIPYYYATNISYVVLLTN